MVWNMRNLDRWWPVGGRVCWWVIIFWRVYWDLEILNDLSNITVEVNIPEESDCATLARRIDGDSSLDVDR